MDLTAQDFINKKLIDNGDIKIADIMVEFAKEHVKLALSAAHDAAIHEMDGRCWANIYNKKFLLDSYPESKIK